jgi:hypothetical protein
VADENTQTSASSETPSSDVPAGGGAAVAETPAWDGSFDSVEKQPWWQQIPDDARGHLRKNFDDHSFLKTVLDGDEGAQRLRAETESLRKSLGEEVAKYKGEAETWKSKHDATKSEFDRYRTEAEERELSRRDEEVRTKFPDIYGHAEKDPEGNITGGAIVEFARLTANGVSDARAAKAVRAMFDLPDPAKPAPEKPKERDVKPPASVDLANKGGLNPAETVHKPAVPSSEDAHRAYKKKLETEEP